jgi:hypothetical protein
MRSVRLVVGCGLAAIFVASLIGQRPASAQNINDDGTLDTALGELKKKAS